MNLVNIWSFVEKSHAITYATINIIVMAHKLDIMTIAEGVETKEQQDLLMDFGCDYVQGYLYSPPVPVAEFEKLIAQQKNLNSHTIKMLK